uniref:ATPase, vacuolar ER assembly factor, Vma12 n=1 Tax=Glycine max TaxID=3847 RepID=C6TMQ8_SOYBN|nr:unknown [Glycine max]
MGTDKPNWVGSFIYITDPIRVFLSGASKDATLSDELRRTSSDLLHQSDVPYAQLRAVWMASDPSTRPDLTRLFSGTRFIFSSPKPREKSEELKARLKKLEDIAERKAYQELVKDITPPKDVPEPFSSYKDQLGFGLHVVVTMFTGYLFGYAAFRALFNHSPAMNAAGGILGLVGAMFVETFLFIIRSSNTDANKTRKSSQKARSSFSTSGIKKNQ